MKKIFTLMGLAALSYGINAQTSTVLLSEDFSDNSADASLMINGQSSFSAEKLSFSIQGSFVSPSSISYSTTPNGQSADSISATYELSLQNPSGQLFYSQNRIEYVEIMFNPISFGGQIYPFSVTITGTQNVSNAKKSGSSFEVTQGFNSPIGSSLSLLNLNYSIVYELAGFSAPSAQMLAQQACPVLFTANPIEMQVCMQQIPLNAPTIENAIIIDNIVITSHKVTGIEEVTTINATPVKAFNLLGREVAVDTKNEAIIVIYSDGSSVREYNAQ